MESLQPASLSEWKPANKKLCNAGSNLSGDNAALMDAAFINRDNGRSSNETWNQPVVGNPGDNYTSHLYEERLLTNGLTDKSLNFFIYTHNVIIFYLSKIKCEDCLWSLWWGSKFRNDRSWLTLLDKYFINYSFH